MSNFICLPLLLHLYPFQIYKVFFYSLYLSHSLVPTPDVSMNPKRVHSEIGLSQANRLDRTESISIQKMYKLMYDQAKTQNNLKNFNKIKYQGLIYKIGEFVEIYHLGANQNYVAKLVNIGQIINNERSQEYISNKIDLNSPILEVEWYMRKTDLPRDSKFQKQFKRILSDSEVFASGQTFVLPVEAIICKCEVLPLSEYWYLEVVDSQIFFTRAAFNSTTETFTPSVNEWNPKYCECQMPYNPDMEWVECEKCEQWFHQDCVFNRIQENGDFLCKVCTTNESKKKKKK